MRLPNGMEIIPSSFADPPTECHATVEVQKGNYGHPNWRRMMLRCQRLDSHPLPDQHRAQYKDPLGELVILRWREPETAKPPEPKPGG